LTEEKATGHHRTILASSDDPHQLIEQIRSNEERFSYVRVVRAKSFLAHVQGAFVRRAGLVKFALGRGEAEKNGI